MVPSDSSGSVAQQIPMVTFEYRERRDWNRAMEPPVILPQAYQAGRKHEERMDDGLELLKRFQEALNLKANLDKKY